MRRIAVWVIYAAVALISVVALLFAVANRQAVTLSLDPFNREAPAIVFSAPLFLVMFAALVAGVLLGGSVVWFKQGRHRRAGRRARAECERTKSELEMLKARGQTLPAPAHVPVIAPF